MQEFLAVHTIKNEVSRIFSKYKHGNDIHGNSKTNEPHKFVLN